MDNVNQTEQSVMALLKTTAKALGEIAPRALIAGRSVQNGQRTIQRTVKVALIVTTNNESLVDGLISMCLNNDSDIYFVGSDVNLQSDLEVDYLFFEAKVMAKIT